MNACDFFLATWCNNVSEASLFLSFAANVSTATAA